MPTVGQIESARSEEVVALHRRIAELEQTVAALRQTATPVRSAWSELELLYQTVPLGLALLDPQFRFVRINEQLAAMNGKPVAEHPGRSVREIVPELATEIETLCRRVLATGTPVQDVEIHGVTPAEPQVERHWLASYFPLRGMDGTVDAIQVVVEEITARKRAEQALHNALAMLEEAQTRARLGSWELDPARMTGTWSRQMYVLFSRDPALGPPTFQEFLDLVHPEDRQTVEQLQAEAWHSGQPLSLDFRGNPAWLGERFFNSTVEYVPATGKRPALLAGTLLDITERKRAERSIQESQERFASVVSTAMDAIITVDVDQRIVLFNHAAEEMFGYRAGDLLGQPLDRLLPERSRQVHAGHIRAFGESGITGRAMHARGTVSGLRASGEEFPIEASIAQAGSGSHKLFTVILRDISERKRAEAAVLEANARLTLLSRKVIEIQEEERRTLARELHDELGQVLSAVSVNLKILQGKADAALRPRLDDTVGIVDRAVQQVRNLSLDLRPTLLDDFGLETALRWYAGRLAERAGLTIEVAAESLCDLPAAARNACFRVAQEALTNVERHGRARHVWIQLRQHEDEVGLVIRDDGRGFDVAQARQRATRGGSLGLLGMQERIALLGGEVAIESHPGHGTTVRVRLPLTHLQDRDDERAQP